MNLYVSVLCPPKPRPRTKKLGSWTHQRGYGSKPGAPSPGKLTMSVVYSSLFRSFLVIKNRCSGAMTHSHGHAGNMPEEAAPAWVLLCHLEAGGPFLLVWTQLRSGVFCRVDGGPGSRYRLGFRMSSDFAAILSPRCHPFSPQAPLPFAAGGPFGPLPASLPPLPLGTAAPRPSPLGPGPFGPLPPFFGAAGDGADGADFACGSMERWQKVTQGLV